MKYLLDTHTFLWWMSAPNKLSDKVLSLLNNQENEIYLSPASTWEIVIKCQVQKLTLPMQPEKYIPSRLSLYNILELPITHLHTLEMKKLPLIHKDPFDRLLISQSKIEKMPLMTKDTKIKQYKGKFIW